MFVLLTVLTVLGGRAEEEEMRRRRRGGGGGEEEEEELPPEAWLRKRGQSKNKIFKRHFTLKTP